MHTHTHLRTHTAVWLPQVVGQGALNSLKYQLIQLKKACRLQNNTQLKQLQLGGHRAMAEHFQGAAAKLQEEEAFVQVGRLGARGDTLWWRV